MTDITRRKELEAELVRTSSEREAILNSALVGMVLSVSRRHEWVNAKFAEMMGYTREELIGQTSALLLPDLASWEDLGRRARQGLERSGTFFNECRLRRRGGELFWVQMAGSCLRPFDPDGGVIWTFLDITERKKSEEDTRQAIGRQRELNELRSRFVAMTSHEFRTPLATILSSGEILKHYGDRLPGPEKAEILDTIAASVQRMMRMLDRVLLLGKAEAQMLEFLPAPLDLRGLCRQLISETLISHPDSPCKLELAFDGEATDGMHDEKLLRHILGNLLSIAMKYSPRGGTVTLAVFTGAVEAIFRVSDRGIGIPGDELAHLFESFHRASNVGSIQGTGLGLAIVKNAVDLYGGTIEVSSDAASGTCFTVRLPSTGRSVAGAGALANALP
jgi:PAS domain S-box-containing protein